MPKVDRQHLLLCVLALLVLLGAFATEIYDSDFWWHLRTGEYIVRTHRLPIPDPFSFTTAKAAPLYPAEAVTRHFNLTHEWLSQVIFYAIHAAGGAPATVLFRALLLTLFCALAGAITWLRMRDLSRAVVCALLCAVPALEYCYDRPYLLTFACTAAAIFLLERRSPRALWMLPALFLFWANCHGGFFMGWVALAAYSGEALLARKNAKQLYLACAVAAILSGLNPNGLRVLEVLAHYRESFLQSTLQEWGAPVLWPPPPFLWLLAAALAVMLWQRRRVRTADWLLLIAYGAAALLARRNAVFAGLIAPVALMTYAPKWARVPRFATAASAALLAAVLVAGLATGRFFQLRTAAWKLPSGAANFMFQHKVGGPMFNTYEHGGYLLWRLWPRQRTFIDGRALSEQVFADYARILYNHDASGGRSSAQLLDDYGIQAIVMNTFEYVSGAMYFLAPAIASDPQTPWKLVYTDAQALVFMRQPPAGVAPLDMSSVFDHMAAECEVHLQHEPAFAACARGVARVYSRRGDNASARRWLGIYLQHPHPPDPEAERNYLELLQPPR